MILILTFHLVKIKRHQINILNIQRAMIRFTFFSLEGGNFVYMSLSVLLELFTSAAQLHQIISSSQIFRYIPCGLIFKLEDLKDSKDSNCVSHNKYIRTQRKEVNRSHFLS